MPAAGTTPEKKVRPEHLRLDAVRRRVAHLVGRPDCSRHRTSPPISSAQVRTEFLATPRDPEFLIRLGSTSDATDLAKLAERTFRDTFATSCTPEDMELLCAESYGTATQRAELNDPDITTLLVEIDNELAGYAQLRSSEAPECVTGDVPIELSRFYVDRPWHGRGIAQELMRRVESEAISRGGRTLWLGVWEHNERAKAFYQKHCFTDVGSHIFMVGTDAQTDRIMTKAITAVTSSR